MEVENAMEDYNIGVVQAGDEASGNFKGACDTANEQTSIREYLHNSSNGWSVKVNNKNVKGVKESIDGVGTKVQIYTRQFENYIQAHEEKKIGDSWFLELCVELWKRMLKDLIAMNVDDLRNGEMAVAVTNIIDINHLKGKRGKIFSDSMSIAMGNVIRELDIAMTAGETAILGHAASTNDIKSYIDEHIKSLEEILQKDQKIQAETKKNIEDSMNILDGKMTMRLKEIEFNIGGTGLGIESMNEKLVDLREGQSIIFFQEKPTKSGIIGPRSNGITAIRKYMTAIAGDNWENMLFDDFLELPQVKQNVKKLSKELKKTCMGLRMWDIATGETTIFNPLVSREILGGVDGEPIADISSIIHVTGNPLRKISEGLRGKEDLSVNLNLTGVMIPQIIEILQFVAGISDEEAMKSLNMGIPYVVVCEKEYEDEVIMTANAQGFVSEKIGTVVKKSSKKAGKIKGVGVGSSEIKLAV